MTDRRRISIMEARSMISMHQTGIEMVRAGRVAEADEHVRTRVHYQGTDGYIEFAEGRVGYWTARLLKLLAGETL